MNNTPGVPPPQGKNEFEECKQALEQIPLQDRYKYSSYKGHKLLKLVTLRDAPVGTTHLTVVMKTNSSIIVQKLAPQGVCGLHLHGLCGLGWEQCPLSHIGRDSTDPKVQEMKKAVPLEKAQMVVPILQGQIDHNSKHRSRMYKYQNKSYEDRVKEFDHPTAEKSVDWMRQGRNGSLLYRDWHICFPVEKAFADKIEDAATKEAVVTRHPLLSIPNFFM